MLELVCLVDPLLGGIHLEIEGTGGSEAFAPGLVSDKEKIQMETLCSCRKQCISL